jgi:hypothetical protein
MYRPMYVIICWQMVVKATGSKGLIVQMKIGIGSGECSATESFDNEFKVIS